MQAIQKGPQASLSERLIGNVHMRKKPQFWPNSSEALAVISVWLIWPILAFVGVGIGESVGDLSTHLPQSVTIAVRMLNFNAMLLPTAAGLAALVMTSRAPISNISHARICHAISVCAYIFCGIVLTAMIPILGLGTGM